MKSTRILMKIYLRTDTCILLFCYAWIGIISIVVIPLMLYVNEFNFVALKIYQVYDFSPLKGIWAAANPTERDRRQTTWTGKLSPQV